MYMDDFKLFSKNKKELETLIQAVTIYSDDIRMEFGLEKCTMLIMKSGKRQMTEGIELQNQEKKIKSPREFRDIRKYWKQTPLNKPRWKKRFKKNTSEERVNYSKPNYIAETHQR